MYWLLDIFGFIVDVYRRSQEKIREVLGYVFIVNLVLKMCVLIEGKYFSGSLRKIYISLFILIWH